MAKIKKSEHWIKFLGTAGARFVMIRQLRASGGLWVCSGSTNVLIDPGPGSLVRCALSKPRLDPSILDGIILTHRHLDHANDINVMIEAMTQGGYKKRGSVFLPEDALGQGGIVLEYVRHFPQTITALKPQGSYEVNDFVFQTSPLLRHPAQTYGLKFEFNGKRVALLSDTGYDDDLISWFDADVLVVNVVFAEPRPGVDHLSIPDVEKIIVRLKPRKTILTHFGLTMVRTGPHALAKKLSWETGLEVVAASDGTTLDF